MSHSLFGEEESSRKLALAMRDFIAKLKNKDKRL